MNTSISSQPVIGLVAEFPPPAAGMTVQAATLQRRLEEDGYRVIAVATNPPLPAPLRFLSRVRGVRGLIAWGRFLAALPRLRRVDVVHLFAASWLNFFLFATPTSLTSRALGRPLVIHYHGGAAAAFLDRWARIALPVLSLARPIVVPSSFLADVFGKYGLRTTVVPNPVSARRSSVSLGAWRSQSTSISSATCPMSRWNGFARVATHF